MSININHSNNSIKATSELKLDAVDNISASDNRIKNVADPIDLQDAVTKSFLETSLENLIHVTNLLVPPQPSTIDNLTLTLNGTSSYRITDVPQIDNTTNNNSVTPGSIVNNVLRNDGYTTSILTQVGPGNNGTLTVIRDGSTTSSITFDENNNDGVYTDTDTITISNNIDYGTVTDNATGFFQCYDVVASGTNNIAPGWHDVKLEQGTGQTNIVTWYTDHSTVPTPTINNLSVTPRPPEAVTYSSTIPHYTSAQVFNVSFNVANLSGDFYPVSDTFFDGISSNTSGALDTIGDLTYQNVGMPNPLPRNYLVGGDTYSINTSVNVKSGTGIGQSNTGARARIHNSYNTATVDLAPNNSVLYMQDNLTSVINESNILVVNVGSGTGNAVRLETTDTDTPVDTSFTVFDSQTSTLNNWDATVVGGILTHDTTNYASGYYPVGPNLSVNRDNAQYFEVSFNRTAVSKFNIVWSGKASGCWVKLPGSGIDESSDTNGWVDATVAYNGSGVPGVNTNDSNGCALGSSFTTGSNVINEKVTVTFGTESSSNATNNRIVVRFKLNSGDAITALQFTAAS